MGRAEPRTAYALLGDGSFRLAAILSAKIQNESTAPTSSFIQICFFQFIRKMVKQIPEQFC